MPSGVDFKTYSCKTTARLVLPGVVGVKSRHRWLDIVENVQRMRLDIGIVGLQYEQTFLVLQKKMCNIYIPSDLPHRTYFLPEP